MALLARISGWFHESSAANDAVVDPEAAYESLFVAIAPARQRLVGHALFDDVTTLPRLRQFMRLHVFPVWEFTRLAKRLQREFDGVDHGASCELYLAAMEEVGARTSAFKRFVDLFDRDVTSDAAMNIANVPREARAFLRDTVDTATSGTTVEVLAAFLFGREDGLARLLPRWAISRSATRFTYHVERHTKLERSDARDALIAVAGSDPGAWAAARASAERTIEARIALWDRVAASM